MNILLKFSALSLLFFVSSGVPFSNLDFGNSDNTNDSQDRRTYKIVDTKVTAFYTNNSELKSIGENDAFYGQDAHYQTNAPSYTDNGDGTITDNVTGLTWQADMGEKITFDDAFNKSKKLNLGGHNDWRVPTIKELYSLIIFTGRLNRHQATELYIDKNYFNQPLGNVSKGEREIDAQTWSATQYVGRTMRNDETVFGVNFIDGRIKGYPKFDPRSKQPRKMYARLVRGNTEYGNNNFVDNGDGTISDLSTGLMWQKDDNQAGVDWKDALSYSQNLELADHDDWRLPNAKELQSIVDYTRSLQTTNSAAIDPMFNTSKIKDPNGGVNFPFFWTSTTHLDGRVPESNAVYICFGEGQGKMHGRVMDVHGAGSQRSDPKSGDKANYPVFFGPQGDVRYVYNFVRSVRSIGE